MTTTTLDLTSTTRTTSKTGIKTDSKVTWKRGLLTGLAAAAAVTTVAAVFRAADHPLSVVDQDGTAGAIPLLGFAQLVLISTVIGIVAARRTSRRTFIRTTVVLTALSCAPSLAWGATAGDKLGLVLTHLVAATIVVPRIARR